MNRKNGLPLIVPMCEPLGNDNGHVYCTERGELCVNCSYPKHGFVCWFSDGSCLKTVMRKIADKGVQNGGRK